jgi:hypothetical protein
MLGCGVEHETANKKSNIRIVEKRIEFILMEIESPNVIHGWKVLQCAVRIDLFVLVDNHKFPPNQGTIHSGLINNNANLAHSKRKTHFLI